MQKKFKIFLSGLIILMIILSLYFTSIISPPSSNKDDVVINNGNDSIFTGFTTSEIAGKLSAALDLGPLKSKELETHGGITSWYKYYYKNGASIIITVDISSKSLWPGLTSPIIMHGGKNSYDEITNDTSKIMDFILTAWKQFLKDLNYELKDEDYDINYEPWSDSGIKVKIRQVCNNEIPLLNTGMNVHISQEESQINTIKINEWSRVKIERNISISLDECKNIIENETSEVSINRSKLNFTGFIYFNENVYYYHNYEVPIEEVNNLSGFIRINSSNLINIENDTIIEKVENEYEEWVGYKFYVNVETNELTFSKYGINYLKK